jgi:predicted small metal-binding protein
MPSFKCKDIGMDDNFEVRNDNEDELLKIIALHAKSSHKIKEITPEVMNKIKRAIQNDDNCGSSCSDYA